MVKYQLQYSVIVILAGVKDSFIVIFQHEIVGQVASRQPHFHLYQYGSDGHHLRVIQKLK